MVTVILMAICAFVGWLFPQPSWAKPALDWVVQKYLELMKKK